MPNNLQQTVSDGFSVRVIPHPDIRHGFDIRGEIDIDFLSWVLDADINLVSCNNQPPVGILFDIGKLEPYDCIPANEFFGDNAALQVQHQQFDVVITLTQV